MAINRLVLDFDTKEPLSNRQLKRLASEASDWLQAVGLAETEDNNPDGAASAGHVHVSTMDRACVSCVIHAQDEKN